jgi:hypothetical protein
MTLITHVQFVSNINGEMFYKDMRNAIDTFQDAGCKVEVQYQPTTTFFSAVILGRKSNEDSQA